MTVTMTFRVEWDKAGGEARGDFTDKLHAFRRNVAQLQLSGRLPRTKPIWIISRKDVVTSPIGNQPYEVSTPVPLEEVTA